MSENEKIDLGKLSVKELVIVLHGKMATVERWIEKKNEADQNVLIDLTILKTKALVWGIVGGGIFTLVVSIIEFVIK
jgi:hypothetical protein